MKIPDSSTLIAIFTELNMPELLTKLVQSGYKILICKEVAEESGLDMSKGTVKQLADAGDLMIYDTPSTDLAKFRAEHPQLGKGECSVLCCARKQVQEGNDYCCVLDDKIARRIANQLRIRFKGTVGLVKKLLERNAISRQEFDDIIYKLRQSSFRISDSVLSKL